MNRPLTAAALALTSATLFAACGTTGADSDDKPKGVESASCASDTTRTATGPVEVTDAFGKALELDAPATRVVALEYREIENLLALCVTPVGIADPKGYATWDGAVPVPAGVKDVGDRITGNPEQIAAADPDLIIVSTADPQDPTLAGLKKLGVPLLAINPADGKDPIKNMKDTFTTLAEATGRGEYADKVLDDFDARVVAAKADLAEVKNRKFFYSDQYVYGGALNIRAFGQGSLVGELGEAIGLENAWKTGNAMDPVWGLETVDVEGVTNVDDATFLWTGTNDPSPDTNAADELAKNPIWNKLPAIKEGRAHPFPQHIWTFGGPLAAEQIIDAYVDVLAK